MKNRRVLVLVLSLVAVIAVLGSAFAVLFMSRTVNFHASVATVGAIQVDINGTTTDATLANQEFGILSASHNTVYLNYTVVNTGNQPVYLTWSITGTGWTMASYSASYGSPIEWIAEVCDATVTFGNSWVHDASKLIAVHANYNCTVMLILNDPMQVTDATFTVNFIASSA